MKHVIFKTMYYMCEEGVGVGSSFMATKDKAEGEGRVTSQDTCSVDKVQRICRLFSCFWKTKSYSVGRIDPSVSRHM